MKLIKQVSKWLSVQRVIHIDNIFFEGTLTYNIATVILPLLILIIVITSAFVLANLLYK
jgi:hypothetical protein